MHTLACKKLAYWSSAQSLLPRTINVGLANNFLNAERAVNWEQRRRAWSILRGHYIDRPFYVVNKRREILDADNYTVISI